MTTSWEGQTISRSYHPPKTADELSAKRRNVEVWAQRTFGVMGRMPDFCSQLTVGMLDAAEVFGQADPRFGHADIVCIPHPGVMGPRSRSDQAPAPPDTLRSAQSSRFRAPSSHQSRPSTSPTKPQAAAQSA